MQHARSGLQKIVTHALRRAPEAERPVLAWPMVCGRTVADRTRALEFVGGVLRVEVPDMSWRAELSALSPQYLEMLNKTLNSAVQRIEFVVLDAKKRPQRSRPQESP